MMRADEIFSPRGRRVQGAMSDVPVCLYAAENGNEIISPPTLRPPQSLLPPAKNHSMMYWCEKPKPEVTLGGFEYYI
jgi:hypothetical protein